ncbi:hypothetical protein CR513_54857, partial [Mucuna pruriens]
MEHKEFVATMGNYIMLISFEEHIVFPLSRRQVKHEHVVNNMKVVKPINAGRMLIWEWIDYPLTISKLIVLLRSRFFQILRILDL